METSKGDWAWAAVFVGLGIVGLILVIFFGA
jgi:hypothetical protein